MFPSPPFSGVDPTTLPHIKQVTIDNIFLLMGKELEELDEAPAGNIIGIQGLQEAVLKTATLSTSPYCPSFCDLTIMATPIYRVAVEPTNFADRPRLMRGLKLLNQADACVQVIVQENGEHVLVTLGEVHLERCVYDLEHEYAKCAVTVSSPIVPLRETIVPQAKLDMVNEAIVLTATEKSAVKSVTVEAANKQCRIKVLAVPLPKAVTDLLEANNDLLKSVANVASVSDKIELRLKDFRAALAKAFAESADLPEAFKKDSILDDIWSFGPKKCGTNILLNQSDFRHQSVWSADGGKATADGSGDMRTGLEYAFVNGFQLASLTGPLCEEPMHGVCFAIAEWHVAPVDEKTASIGSIAGKLDTNPPLLFRFCSFIAICSSFWFCFRDFCACLCLFAPLRSADIGHQRRVPQSIPESTAAPSHADVLVYHHRVE